MEKCVECEEMVAPFYSKGHLIYWNDVIVSVPKIKINHYMNCAQNKFDSKSKFPLSTI